MTTTETSRRRKLTAKQEAFALAYFETGNAAEAYRTAYDVVEDTKDHWVYVEANQLLDHPEITLRLKELREQAEKLSIYNRHKAMDELEEARTLALKVGQPSGAVSATTAKIKLTGLDRPQRHEVSGPDGEAIPLSLDPKKLSTGAIEEILNAATDDSGSDSA